MSLINELQKLGLSDKEAKVYLATLELAQSSVQQIADKAGVNRTTTYVVLESLIKRGLCSTYEQDKKTVYIAANPDTLESVFEIQKKEIEEKKKNFNKVLPDLQLIYNRQDNKPVIRFFEGIAGFLNSVSEFYKEKDIKDGGDVRMIYNKDMLNSLFGEDERNKYRDVRLNKKIKSKVLYNYKDGSISSTLDGQRIKISNVKFPISCDIAIYGNNVRISSLGKNPSSVLLKDEEIAKTLKSIFDLAWERAQELEKDE